MEVYCRICLGNFPQPGSFHISHKISMEKTLIQIVCEIASVQMSEDDSFSKYICKSCYDQLKLVNDFRELIIKSDIHLKNKGLCLSPLSQCCNLNEEVNKKNSVLSNTVSGLTNSHAQACKVIIIKNESHKVVNLRSPDNSDGEEFESDACFKSRESESNLLPGTKAFKKLIEDGPLISEEYNENIKTQTIIRVKSGRKPSNVTKPNRKIHEFKCEICSKILFGRSNRLEQHIITAHSNIKKFSCEFCDKKFKSKQQLVNHTRTHTGEKPYQCKVCKEAFSTSQNLFNHKKKHTGQYKNFKCEMCDKGYCTPGELETHKRIVHTGEKPFLCEICSKAFSSPRNLGLHIRSVHEKNEKCPKCDIVLSSKRIKHHLQKHQDREEGNRRYTCDKCGKGFFTPHALKKHHVVHTGEKPYICQICFKAFGQKSAVDIHMRTHSDVRSFSCEMCGKTFKYKQHLQQHISKHHTDSNKNKHTLVENND